MKDSGLTEIAVQEWVKQAERDTKTREDSRLTSDERRELAELRRENRRLREGVGILKQAAASLRSNAGNPERTDRTDLSPSRKTSSASGTRADRRLGIVGRSLPGADHVT